MKIEIDIPEDTYKNIIESEFTEHGFIWDEDKEVTIHAIRNSKPLVTPQIDVLDKIRDEILDEAEYAYANFDKYKYEILDAEPDELPDDDFRFGMERAVEIIDKYKAESEDKK